MIIKEVTKEDITTWLGIVHETDDIIARMVPDIAVYYTGLNDYMHKKVLQHEAFKAYDTISGKCMGVIAFSRNDNRISYLGIPKSGNFHTIGSRMVEFALKALDCTKGITASVPDSKAGVFQKAHALYQYFSFMETNDKIMENGVQVVRMKRAGQNPS
jgi:hypothetical protein